MVEYLLSHLWLLYFLGLILSIGLFALFDCLSAAILLPSAGLELIPVLGLLCVRSGLLIPAAAAAFLCAAAALAAVLVFLGAAFAFDLPLALCGAGGIALSVLCTVRLGTLFPDTLQAVLASCCICGLFGVILILLFLGELGGMGKT